MSIRGRSRVGINESSSLSSSSSSTLFSTRRLYRSQVRSRKLGSGSPAYRASTVCVAEESLTVRVAAVAAAAAVGVGALFSLDCSVVDVVAVLDVADILVGHIRS